MPDFRTDLPDLQAIETTLEFFCPSRPAAACKDLRRRRWADYNTSDTETLSKGPDALTLALWTQQTFCLAGSVHGRQSPINWPAGFALIRSADQPDRPRQAQRRGT